MFRNTHTIRRAAASLALAGAIAALASPTALAGGSSRYGPPDGWYPYVRSLTKANTTSLYGQPDGWYYWAAAQTRQQHAKTSIDGRSPDTRDAAAATHQPSLAQLDGRSPDTVDAALAAQQPIFVALDGRSPDTIDAAVQAHAPVVTVFRSPGFAWGDFGIGVASALGLVLLIGGLATSTRAGRERLRVRSA